MPEPNKLIHTCHIFLQSWPYVILLCLRLGKPLLLLPSFTVLWAKCCLLKKSPPYEVIYLLEVTILVLAKCLKDDCSNCHEGLDYTELQRGLGEKREANKMNMVSLTIDWQFVYCQLHLEEAAQDNSMRKQGRFSVWRLPTAKPCSQLFLTFICKRGKTTSAPHFKCQPLFGAKYFMTEHNNQKTGYKEVVFF